MLFFKILINFSATTGFPSLSVEQKFFETEIEEIK